LKKDINKKMSQDDMRLMNNLLVLKLLREEGAASMPQLSKRTMLTLPAISAIISELEMFKLVKNSGVVQVKRGRFPAMYQFNSEYYHVIGLAIRSYCISAAVVNLDGNVLEVLSENIEENEIPEQIVEKACALIEKVMEKSKVTKNQILGFGVSMHGIVDPNRGISVYPAQLRWRDYPFIDKLKERFDFPMKMDNDMNCMLLAEKWFGRTKDIETFAIVNVDYGVGMGIMANNSTLRGEDFGAGQIGHIPIVDNKIKCECGRVGCLETIASEKAILRDFLNKIKDCKTSDISKLGKLNIKQINLEDIYKAANEGDAIAIEVIGQAGEYLGKGLSILINILNPRMIIITGRILRSREIFFAAFQKSINKYALPTNIKNLLVYPSDIQEHNDLVGAATLWIEALFTGKVLFGQQAGLD
jgi:predicted NBD/HSP70 family sugar kinase